ncbi:hypothetical protein F2P81_002364 [Scophthalmus maximus]|uniref:Uncharacterized protein n=1 Tax=Scophthalmus maximus TaxID=52904 RepID=A0A6A4TKT5_SCOMX|nr:hypothetical protein F2P81_002364 [Scophthalmus maximus]
MDGIEAWPQKGLQKEKERERERERELQPTTATAAAAAAQVEKVPGRTAPHIAVYHFDTLHYSSKHRTVTSCDSSAALRPNLGDALMFSISPTKAATMF